MQRLFRRVLVALSAALIVAGVGCTPVERAWCRADTVRCRQAWDAMEAHQDWKRSQRPQGAPSDAGLARLRACESGGDYGAVNPTGSFRGAYQFHRTTWNSVARSNYPHLVGVDPAAAAPSDQDRMARALFQSQGRGPWPVCGRRI